MEAREVEGYSSPDEWKDSGDNYIESVEKGGTVEKTCYNSVLPRRILSCEADHFFVANFFLVVAVAKIRANRNKKTKRAMEDSNNAEHELLTVYDNKRDCKGCVFILQRSEEGRDCQVVERRALVYTLLHGTNEVLVLDLVCESCKAGTVFDGRDSGLFAWLSTAVYSRELVDFWLYQIAMLGSTFRPPMNRLKQSVVLLGLSKVDLGVRSFTTDYNPAIYSMNFYR